MSGNVGRINARCAAVIVRSLYESGVRHAVVSPGSRNTPIVLALDAAQRRWSDFSVHVVVDERSAGFLGLGLARGAGAPVILSCTSGSAGASYHPALVEAHESRIPLIAITADRPAELHHRAAPQAIAQADFFGPHVDVSITLPVDDEAHAEAAARTAISHIIRATTCSDPGPAHLNLQCREPLWDHWTTAAEMVALINDVRTIAQEDAVTLAVPLPRSLADAVDSSRRGLIVVGPVDAIDVASEQRLHEFRGQIRALASATGWPVVIDPVSQLRCNEQGLPNAITTVDALVRSATFRAQFEPDFVLMLGAWPTSKSLGKFISACDAQIVSVQPTGRLVDPWDCVDRVVRASHDALVPFAESLRAAGASSWVNGWLDAQKIVDGVLHQALSNGGFDELQIASAIAANLKSGEALHVGSSMPIRDLDIALGHHPDDHLILASRGANGIDGTIATAAGESIALKRHVTAWMGDLTFLHDASSLAWVPADASLTVVVSENRGGGIFHHLPIAANDDVFELFFATPPTAEVASVARGYGWDVVEVRELAKLEDALTEKRARQVIVAHFDRHENIAAHRRLWKLVDERLETHLQQRNQDVPNA